MVGLPESPVEIDGSYHSGRRKYNRGQLNNGDKMRAADDGDEEGDRDEADNSGATSLNANNDEEVQALGPWVFGACSTSKFVRFRLVDDRKAVTQIPIIKEWVSSGSTITSDEWRAYKRLPDHVFHHGIVCRKIEFVSRTDFDTQTIERMWVESKAYLRRARGDGKLHQ